MDSSILFLTSLFFLFPLLIFLQKWSQKQPKNRAPSPPSLPIIGHLHLLNKEPLYKSLQNLSQTYGPILSLSFGFRRVLVVSSPSAVEEIFTKNDLNFSNRPRFLSGKLLNYNFTTLGAAPYGPLWRNLRRLTALEVFSTARLNEFSSVRKEEVELLLRALYKSSSREGFARVEMKSKFSEVSFNIVMRIVAGKRYFGDGGGGGGEGEEEARGFRELITEMTYLSGASNLGDFLPFVEWIDYEGVVKRMKNLQRKMDVFLQGLVDECRNDEDRGSKKTMIGSMLALQELEPLDYSDEIIKGIILVCIFCICVCLI